MRTWSPKIVGGLHAIYLASFFFSLHYAFLVYVQSSYLSTFVSSHLVSAIFIVGALLSILGSSCLPWLINRCGEELVLFVSIVIVIASTLGLAFFHTTTLVVASFIVYDIFEMMLWILLNLYVLHFSKHATTGDTRGQYMTIVNAAIAVSPIIVGRLVEDNGYGAVYSLGAILLIPLFFLMTSHITASPLTRRATLRQSKLAAFSMLAGLGKTLANKNIAAITSTNFLLEFFYTSMTIYTPIYLHQSLHMPWSHIGLVFSIMLIPFIIFELPLGLLADARYGEQELLITGLFITAATTTLLSAVANASVFVWASLLFLTRTGASFIEIMNETYFFKHVFDADSDIVSFYRSMRPWAYVFAPLVMGIFLSFFPLEYFFLALGAIVLIGLYPAYILKDTL